MTTIDTSLPQATEKQIDLITKLAARALGPCGVEVVALLAEFGSFTPAAWDAVWDAVEDDARDDVWYAAWYAARDAVQDAVRDDAWYAARDAAWDAAEGGGGSAARTAVLATLVRDLITPEQYEFLMTPVEAARAVMRATDALEER